MVVQSSSTFEYTSSSSSSSSSLKVEGVSLDSLISQAVNSAKQFSASSPSQRP